MSGAPARGTAPRRLRRQHHHHHHHHHHHNHQHQQDTHNNNRKNEHRHEPVGNYIDKGHPKVNEENRPKVNPIFLWALQREQRIIEVRCEDYDKRNRIKLTKTAHGWRSIPRTASNIYTASLTTNGHTCVERTCESPAAVAGLSSATSSPNSARWSPTTISSSNLAAWSTSSTRSSTSSSSHLTAISSPSREGGETSREIGVGNSASIALRSRNQSDGESLNDFDDSCSRSTVSTLRRIEKNLRKGRRRDAIRTSKCDKRRKSLDTTRETRAAILSRWNNGTENNQINSEEDSPNDLTDVEEMGIERTIVDGRRMDTRQKRRRGRHIEIDKRHKKHRRSSENQDTSTLSVMSSPRSWERLMNGTRFLNSGPIIEQSRVVQENQEVEEHQEGEEQEEDGEYDEIGESTVQVNHFGSIDLERAKRDQHLQPRVVLEQLRMSGTSEPEVRNAVSMVYEDDMEKEEITEEKMELQEEDHEVDESREKFKHSGIDFKDTARKETVSMSDKSEIRDILSMLDSTGSPVLATDTPTAHLPSCHDSTKTNISSCYENRDCTKLPCQRPRDETENLRSTPIFSPTVGRPSAKHCVPLDISTVRLSENGSRDPIARFIARTSPGAKKSNDLSSSERERIVNGKLQRKENSSEAVDSSSSERGTSSEILEALRSTPGLSVSITTRPNVNENRHEPSEIISRNSHKRPASALLVEKLLPNSPQQARQSTPPTICYGSSEVTCSQDSNNDLTLEAILATPVRSFERRSGPGLAAVVNRLSNRPNQTQDLSNYEDRPLDHRMKNTRLDYPVGRLTIGHKRVVKQNDEMSGLKRPLTSQRNIHSINEQYQHYHPHQNHRSENKKTPSRMVPPAKQLRRLMDNSSIPIPDPLLVPRDRLPSLAAAPAIEIPKLLNARPELRLPEALTRPDLLRDPDLLVISLAHLQQVLDQGDGSVCEYTYRPPHPMALGEDDDDDEFGEEDELADEDDEDDNEELVEDEEDDDEEEEDQDVPEQSLDLDRNETMDVARVNGIVDDKRRNRRVPPKLISCKPIGSLMPGPIDLSRNCSIRSSLNSNRCLPSFVPGSRQLDISTTQLPPPPLLRVRTGLLKQEPEVTSTELPSTCTQDDSHLWHPLFGSQKRQTQQHQQQQQQHHHHHQHQQQQQQQQQQQKQQEQQTHRTPWHRTTLAS